jgi:UDP-N-acetylmuramoylalanine-D-glutamate ligase
MLQVVCKCCKRYKSLSCTDTISALSDKDALKFCCISTVNAKTTKSSILVQLLGESENPQKFSGGNATFCLLKKYSVTLGHNVNIGA